VLVVLGKLGEHSVFLAFEGVEVVVDLANEVACDIAGADYVCCKLTTHVVNDVYDLLGLPNQLCLQAQRAIFLCLCN